MSSKRRKVVKDDDKVRLFEESTEEFRSRFIASIGFRSRDWKELCKICSVQKVSGIRWGKISKDEIATIIVKNETEDLRFNLESIIMDKVDDNESVKSKLESVISDYFDDSNFTRKRLIALIDKFFSSYLSKTKGFAELRRKEEELVLSNVSPLTNVYLSEIRVPIEVVYIIMEYYPSNYEDAICSLACVNEKWLRIVLETWKKVKISDNYMLIPKLVLMNVKYIEFEKPEIEDKSQNTENLPDLSYCFDQISKTKLRGLDFTGLDGIPKKSVIKAGTKICLDEFRNLQVLKVPEHVSFITKFLKITKSNQLRNLKELQCGTTDFTKTKILENFLPGLRCLRLYCKEKNGLNTVFRKMLMKRSLPRLEELEIRYLKPTIGKDLSKNCSKFISNDFTPNLKNLRILNRTETNTTLSLDLLNSKNITNIFVEGFVVFNSLPLHKMEELLFELSEKRGDHYWRADTYSDENMDVGEKMKRIVSMFTPDSKIAKNTTMEGVKNLYIDVNFPFSNPISYNESGSSCYSSSENRYFNVNTNESLAKTLEKCLYHSIGYTSPNSVLVHKILYTFYLDTDYVLDVSIVHHHHNDNNNESSSNPLYESHHHGYREVTIQIFSDFFLDEEHEDIEDNFYLHNPAYNEGWRYSSWNIGNRGDFSKKKQKLHKVVTRKQEKNYVNMMCKLLVPLRFLLLEEREDRKVEEEREWQGSTRSDFEKGFKGSKWILKSQQDEDYVLENLNILRFVKKKEEKDDDDEEDFQFIYFFDCL